MGKDRYRKARKKQRFIKAIFDRLVKMDIGRVDAYYKGQELSFFMRNKTIEVRMKNE